MHINPNATIQQAQTKKVGGQNPNITKMMRETLASLPEQTQSEVKSLMSTLDPTAKKEAASKMAQIESSSMTVEDLTKAIMDIFKPNTTPSKSSFPSSFNAYA